MRFGKSVSVALFALVLSCTYAQPHLTQADRAAVFLIATKRGVQATAFEVERNGRQYFVTAGHFLDSIEAVQDTFYLSTIAQGMRQLILQKVARSDESADIGIFALNLQLPIKPKDRTPLSTNDSYKYGSDAWVLGFPLGLTSKEPGTAYPQPIVTHGYLAGRASPSSFYLDYHTNPGSSGSPVFVENLKGELRLLGVVAAYEPAPLAGDKDHQLKENSGIAIVTDVSYVYHLIDANPIGYKLR